MQYAYALTYLKIDLFLKFC